MAIKKYYDSDCNLGVLDGKTVAVIGFGSQGHAHSENLAESGVNVVVGLRKGSAHWEKASEFAATHPNFKVMEVEEAAKAGDVYCTVYRSQGMGKAVCAVSVQQRSGEWHEPDDLPSDRQVHRADVRGVPAACARLLGYGGFQLCERDRDCS